MISFDVITQKALFNFVLLFFRKISSIENSTEDTQTAAEEDEGENGYTDIDEDNRSLLQDGENVHFANDAEGCSDAETDESWSRHSSDYEESDEESVDEEQTITQQSKHIDNGEQTGEHLSMVNLKEFVFDMMQKTRTLIKTIHRSSGLDKYVRDQISVKQEEANKRAREENTEPIIYNELVMDFRVRWNSSFEMLERFIKLSSVINDVTFTAKTSDGVTSELASKLSRLMFSHDDWHWLSSLKSVLGPFEQSTCLLSGRSYQTLAVGKMVLHTLKDILSRHKTGETMLNRLKVLLLESFEKYCENKVPPEVDEAMMVSLSNLFLFQSNIHLNI